MPKSQKAKKGIIFILLSVVVVLSIIFYYYLLNMDKKYSMIIRNEAVLYNNIQDITFGANNGYLLLYKLVEINDQQKRDSLLIQKNLSVAKNDSLINDILFNYTEYKDRTYLNQLILSRQEYVHYCARFVEYLLVDKKDSARYLLLNKIEPSFYQYQKELISFIDANTLNVMQNSGNITSEIKRNSFIVLLFGLSPVIIFSLFLLVLGVLLLIMIFILKDKGDDRYR
jgi:hypothetical protein